MLFAPVSIVLALAGVTTVEGVVEAQQARWDGGMIVTRSTVRVDRVVAGAAPAVLVIEHHGGSLDGYGQHMSSEATLILGEPVTLDVELDGAQWRIAGGIHGKHDRHGPFAFVRTSTLSAIACQGRAPHSLYWNRLDVALTFDDAYSADIAADADTQAALTASMTTWNAVTCSYLKLGDAGTITAAPVGYVPGGPNYNAVKWIETSWPENRQAIAATLTTFECDTGKLVDADVLFNGEDFTFTVEPDLLPTAADVENTMTHELGHLVGFDHSPDPQSTMYAEAPLGETIKRDLTADDAAGMCDVYTVGEEPDLDGGCCGTGAGGGRGSAALAAAVAAMLVTRRRRRA